MDFLNKPVSEMWKATKRTLAEIMDSNEDMRAPGSSSPQTSSYRGDIRSDQPQPASPSQSSNNIDRKSRSSFGYVRGRHRSRESNASREDLDGERENRPMDCNIVATSANTMPANSRFSGQRRSRSVDSLDFAEVQTSGASGMDTQVMPKIKSKDKQPSDKDRTRNAWTKFRMGFNRSFNTNEMDGAEGTAADSQSPILPSRLDKTSPTYVSNGSSGSPGKTKSSSRSSRRTRGDLGQKSLDFRSRFRSNSSDRATMKQRQREERDRVRRSSYSRSTSFDAKDDAKDHEDLDDDAFNDDDDIGDDQTERVKMKLLSMWNNVKYGWTVKTKTNFSIHKPIWFLGRCYHQRPEDPDPVRQPSGSATGTDSMRSMVIEKFKQDFISRIWMTYRREFPTLAGSNLTSDCGWGCMLRSGQMLLAHSLIMHFLGRDWNLYHNQSTEQAFLHRQIIRWFGDQPLDMSPFSVHRLVSIGQTNGKKVGDWYGPASVAHIIKEAMDSAHELNPLLGQLCVYVAQDCTVYKQDVIDLCRSRSKNLLQPIYSDVPSDTSEPIACSMRTPMGKDQSPGVHHEQLQRSSPFVGANESRPSPASPFVGAKEPSTAAGRTESGLGVGERLAQSHETGASAYSGRLGHLSPPSRQSVSSGSSAGTGVSSSWHVVSTSSSLGGACGPGMHGQPHSLAAKSNNLNVPGSEWGSPEVSKSLPAMTGHSTGHESPDFRTSVETSSEFRTSVDACSEVRIGDRLDVNPMSGVRTSVESSTELRTSDRLSVDTSNELRTGVDRTSVDTSIDSRTGDRLSVDTRSTGSADPSVSQGVPQKDVVETNHFSDRSVEMQDMTTLAYSDNVDGEVFDMDEDVDRTKCQDLLDSNAAFVSPQNKSLESSNASFTSTPASSPRVVSEGGISDSPQENPQDPLQRLQGNLSPSDFHSHAHESQIRTSSPYKVLSQETKTSQQGPTLGPNTAGKPSGTHTSTNHNPTSGMGTTINHEIPSGATTTTYHGLHVPSDTRTTANHSQTSGTSTTVNQGLPSDTRTPTNQSRTSSPTGSTTSPNGLSPDGKKPWCACIILVPVRLGGDEVNSVYVRPIQSLFTLDSCLGIIGGKPRHSLYFVGFQEEKLVHLDPHYCQQVVDMRSRDFPFWSFHCMSPRKMSIGKMDPSCTVGFYIRTEEDFERFCEEVPKCVSPLGTSATDYPMFIVRDGRCGDWQNRNTNTNRPERYLRVRHVDENGRLIAPVKESEDFVLLDN